MAGTLQSPGLIKDVYDKLVFTTSDVDADTHEIYMTDTITDQDQQIKSLDLNHRQVYSLAHTGILEGPTLAYDISRATIYQPSDGTIDISRGHYSPLNGRIIKAAISVEGAVENVGAYVDFGISVWTNSYVDEDHLHVNVNKGYERLNLETPGNDLDSYNQVVFDPDTMDDLNSNTFFRGESFVCWWRFNNVDLHLAPNPLMRVSVLVEYYA